MGIMNTKVEKSEESSNGSFPDYSLLATENKSYLEFKVLIRRYSTGAVVQQRKCISGSPQKMKELFDEIKSGNRLQFENPLNYDGSDDRDEVVDVVNVKLYTVNGVL